MSDLETPKPFSVQPGLNGKQEAEGLTLIGWCWGAPKSVKAVIGKRVWVDMKDRTVKARKKK